MAYCVMNVDKQRRSAVHGLQIEANRKPGDGREFARSDIEPERTGENIFLREQENWNTYITQQIRGEGLKERKDSVVAITGVYTASPEWFDDKSPEQIRAYFEDCLMFHDRTYGRAFNAVIHMDEQTPHMQVVSIPIVHDEKGAHLSAKILMGGRGDYQQRQDSFWEQVGRQHGLDRGERRDPAELKKHLTKREWQIQEQEKRAQEAAAAAIRAEGRMQRAGDQAMKLEHSNKIAQQDLRWTEQMEEKMLLRIDDMREQESEAEMLLAKAKKGWGDAKREAARLKAKEAELDEREARLKQMDQRVHQRWEQLQAREAAVSAVELRQEHQRRHIERDDWEWER